MIKYHDLPQRSYSALADLEAAIDTAFATYKTGHFDSAKRQLDPGLPAYRV